MKTCLRPEAREEFLHYARELESLLRAKASHTAADWLLLEIQ